MGELERNMRDDVGQPQGNAPSTDNGGQMDMFEDERERASLHRRGAFARSVAKRCLVAFLAFAMAFGTTPAQLWAEGAEGVVEAVAQATAQGETGSDGAVSAPAEQGNANAPDSEAAATGTATSGAVAGDDGSATESPAASGQPSTASASEAGSAAAVTAARAENTTDAGDTAKKQVEVSFSIIGTDADGKAQTWVAPTQLKLDEGATAADAFVKLQQKTGFKADYDPNTAYGFYLKSITSPSDGRTLAYDPTTYAFWQLFVDGASSSVGASSVKLTQGQKIEFAYTAGSASPVVKDQVAANVTVIGRDAQGNTQTWVDNAQYVVTSGSSALDLTKVALEANDIDAVAAGSFILSLKYNGVELGTPLDYSTYWQLFINGKSSDYTADNVTIHAGDTVTWFYGGWGDQLPSDSVHASVQVLGKDKDGKQQVWASTGQTSLKAGSTARDLLEQTGLELKATEESWGWYLRGITSPLDGETYCGSDAATNSYWRFCVKGKSDVKYKFADVGAGAYKLQEGDAITFMYAGDSDALPGQVLGSVDIIGPDINGNNTRWATASNVSLPEGSTAQSLIETVLKAKGVTYNGSQSGAYWLLNSITSPYDKKAYAWDGATNKFWHLYINGEVSSLCANQVTLKSGDKVTLAYTDDSAMPDPDKIVVDPSATTPDWDAEWAGYGNSGNGSTVTDAKTPAQAAGLKWAFDWKAESGQQYANCSEPVIANGFVYIATENELIKIDSSTGKKVASAPLASKVSYTSRPIYTNGLIIVPLNGGAVQAITADRLICKWLTPGLTDLTQSSCTVVSDGEYVYVGSVDISYDENYNATYGNGSLKRIKIATGEVSWQNIDASEGYYWTGAALTDKYNIVPTSAGTLKCIDKATGDVVSSVKLGAVANADCIADPSNGSTFYQMTHDGKLHVISLSAKGVLSEQKTVDLGLTNNLSAPAVSGDNLIVGGQTASGAALAIHNLKTGKTTMVAAADGKALPAGLNGIAATPLVSVQGDKTYVYFTVNSADTKDYVNYSAGGGVYRYTLGDAEATQIYDAADHYQYCDSPVIADASGNLYYINDSGTLFKLGAVESWTVSFNSNGGSACDTKFVATADGKLVKPADPTREGYTFGGWYTDEACTQAYDFSTPVTTDLTLYAKWTKNATNPGGNGGAGSNSGNGSGTGAGTGSGTGAGTGSGTKGGAVAPGQKPVSKTTVSTKTETKDNKSDKKDSDKSDKKDEKKSDKKDGKSDKKSDSKSDTGSASTTTAKKSSGASEQETGTNPLAIVGIAAGVIGLALIAVFVLTKRGKGDGNAR